MHQNPDQNKSAKQDNDTEEAKNTVVIFHVMLEMPAFDFQAPMNTDFRGLWVRSSAPPNPQALGIIITLLNNIKDHGFH